MARRLFNRLLNMYCRARLHDELPNLRIELNQYLQNSETTGTQPITLWLAVKAIMKNKPQFILECGTGASTIVLSMAAQKIQEQQPDYQYKIVSMESVKEWFDIAVANLPPKHSKNVEIVYGPRQQFYVSMFRGYVHSNIPEHPYDFIFLDGPNFDDENGTSFCADLFFILESTKRSKMHGVIDGRTSTAFVLQTLFGLKSCRYFMSNLACTFQLPTDHEYKKQVSTDFKSDFRGKLSLGGK